MRYIQVKSPVKKLEYFYHSENAQGVTTIIVVLHTLEMEPKPKPKQVQKIASILYPKVVHKYQVWIHNTINIFPWDRFLWIKLKMSRKDFPKSPQSVYLWDSNACVRVCTYILDYFSQRRNIHMLYWTLRPQMSRKDSPKGPQSVYLWDNNACVRVCTYILDYFSLNAEIFICCIEL